MESLGNNFGIGPSFSKPKLSNFDGPEENLASSLGPISFDLACRNIQRSKPSRKAGKSKK